MSQTCPVCGDAAHSRPITVRGGKAMTLWNCAACDFDFFDHDPTTSLVADKLDQTRLKAAGLDIPTVERDFANGLRQSTPYIEEYLNDSDRNRNILEIGCSWGYFLQLVRDAGAKPYGVELNSVRADYVEQTLHFPCDHSLDACEKRGVRFKKIFMFYVLEYVPQPLEYIKRLSALLEDDGKIIVITPSLRDPIKDLWHNTAFANFFYDEHAINYFSPLTVRRLIERLPAYKSSMTTRQGYRFVNHVSWFLTGAPRTTGIVGGDNFVKDITARLRTPHRNSAQDITAAHLADMIEAFDAAYKGYLEAQQSGNQIRIVIGK